MNRDLIKKYKPEFEHWLHGGELLIAKKTVSMTSTKPLWEYLIQDSDWNCKNSIIVINDEYVVFRKALAEGKIVQWKSCHNDDNSWIDTFDNFQSGVKYYRIKPKGPKFKVGDWVRKEGICAVTGKYSYIHRIQRIIPCDDSKDNIWCTENRVFFSTEIELWRPKVNEWCWFINNRDKPLLKQFKQMCTVVPTNYVSQQGVISGRVEPYMGTLPSCLQNK